MKWGYQLTITYVVFALVVAGGFIHIQLLAERIERQSIERAHELCVTSNTVKESVIAVLALLAKPREDDRPGEAEQRQKIFEQVTPPLALAECPPPPPR